MSNLAYFVILSIAFFVTSCGIEDTLYFKEPSSIGVEYDNDDVPYIEFYGYNQEKGSEYLFVGYDIYYYFGTSSDTKKKAIVYKPVPRIDKGTVKDGENLNLVTVNDIRGNRDIFDGMNDGVLAYIYQKVSLPVTYSMIEDVLYEGNSDNVVLRFDDSTVNDANFSNPLVSNKKILFDRIYPALADYPTIESTDEEFKGFLDARFYTKNSITASETTGDYKKYKCYMYFVAKGLDDTKSNTSLDTSLISSSNSSTVTVTFTIYED